MPKEWKKPKPTEGQRAKAASDAKKTIARNKKRATTTRLRTHGRPVWLSWGPR